MASEWRYIRHVAVDDAGLAAMVTLGDLAGASHFSVPPLSSSLAPSILLC
jgi:hypothetical protein